MTRLIFVLALASLACGYITPTDTSAPIKNDIIAPRYVPQIVTTSPLTVRKSPCLPSSKVDYLEAGEAVVLLGAWKYCTDGGAWVLTVDGWVNAKYLEEE